MRKYLQELVTEISHYLEILLSLILTIAMIFFAISLVANLPGFLISDVNNNDLFENILGRALTLAVGVELIKMLSKPSPGTVIEVLLFALTRQMIVDHPKMFDFLLGIIAVAILFAIRRYLFVKFDESTSIMIRGSQTLKMTKIIAHVSIDGAKEEKLRDYMTKRLQEENHSISVGAVLNLGSFALRIDKMRGGLITRVEVIRDL
ncbi:phosphate-starvation-inducible PsiE family protein [Streptococcus parauberis]|uniref:phosphate-starvation-inducible PsiE family protein n=1 Tax=Streptococcus parauberis TaxID=1348 RepID=UPI000C1C8A80|nr:phosphate-starvation-inducible PsiE family protein [Streptococcus parauberis]PIO78269.1 hypothetical protein ADO05_01600 [Streptococcus parauberis]POS67839.1 hypothetical protein AOS90_00529 [Streptococcus parauberis]